MEEKPQTDTGARPAPKRSETLDVMKGLGMISVILIHMRTEEFLGYGFLMTLFYAVPLYFFVSGYLLSSGASASGFFPYLKKRAKGLLLPYVCFFFVSYLWMEIPVALAHGAPAFSFATDWGIFFRAFLFAGEYLDTLPVVPTPIWFLHALFFISIAFYFVVKIRSLWVQAVVAAALCAVSVPLQAYLQRTALAPFWLAGMLAPTLFFMLCGHFVRVAGRYMPSVPPVWRARAGRVSTSFLALPLLLAVFRLMQLGRGGLWAITSAWFFPGALAFIAACCLLARETRNRVLLFVGRNSLLYLALHPLALELPFIHSLPEFFQNNGFDATAAFLLAAVCTFLVVSLAVWGLTLTKNALSGRAARMYPGI